MSELPNALHLAVTVLLCGLAAVWFLRTKTQRIRQGQRSLIEAREAAIAESATLRTQLEKMDREAALLKFQLHWHRRIPRAENPCEAVLKVLEGWSPNPRFTGRFTGADGVVLPRDGVSGSAYRETLRPNAVASRRLQQDRWGRLHRAADFLVDAGTPEFESLHGFVLPAELEEAACLFLSDLPTITGAADVDGSLLAALIGEMASGRTRGTARRPPVSDGEIELVREMLELRMVTDEPFEHPLELLQEYLKKLAELTGFERASLYFLNDRDPQVADHFSSGGAAVSAELAERWKRGEAYWLRFHTTATEQPVILNDPSRHALEEELVFRAGLLMPVRSGRETLGFLILSSRQPCPVSANDEQLARWAAEFLLQTLDRALDRAVIEEQARRDGLTDLANRRTFDAEIDRQLRQGAATGSPCGLLLIDADHFKRINDEHGHPTGDRVLRGLSKIIGETVHATRISDRPLVSRYGGEEFAVLLPNVNAEGAARIAETIREAVALTPLVGDRVPLRLTVSIGTAVAPVDGTTPEDLLARADAALYAAKSSGRNRVVRAGESAAIPSRLGAGSSRFPAVNSKTEALPTFD